MNIFKRIKNWFSIKTDVQTTYISPASYKDIKKYLYDIHQWAVSNTNVCVLPADSPADLCLGYMAFTMTNPEKRCKFLIRIVDLKESFDRLPDGNFKENIRGLMKSSEGKIFLGNLLLQSDGWNKLENTSLGTTFFANK